MPAPRRARPLGPILAIAGGAVAAIGCLLSWFTFTADLSGLGGTSQKETASGLDLSDGPIFLGVMVAVVLLGVGLLIGRKRGGRIAVGVVGALASLFTLGFALYDALTPKNQVIDELVARTSEVLPADQARAFVESLFDEGFLTITVGFGLWMVVVGAAVALAGTVTGALTRVAVETPAMPSMDAAPARPVAAEPPAVPGEGPDADVEP